MAAMARNASFVIGLNARTNVFSRRRDIIFHRKFPSPSIRSKLPNSQTDVARKADGKLPSPPILSVGTGKLLLIGTTVLWGIYGVTIRFVYSQPGAPHPSVLTLVRKVVSVAFFALFLPLENGLKLRSGNESESNHKWDKNWMTDPKVWRKGGELGFLTFMGTAFQVIGLEHTPATRAGFEIQLTSILVPLLDAFSGQVVSISIWTAAALASFGLLIIAISPSGDHADNLDMCPPPSGAPDSTCQQNDFSASGDVFVISAALFYALNVVRTSTHLKEVPPVQLTSVNMVVSMLMSALWVGSDLWIMSQNGEPLTEIWTSWNQSDVLFAVVFSGVFSGAVASLLQNFGQSVVSPSESQVVYSLQSVWNAIFAALLLDEAIRPSLYVGGGIIVLATLLTTKRALRDL